MDKHTESPSPTWQKVGLMTAFLLIIIASSAAQALAEGFGVGAEVEVEVERAEEPPTTMDNNPEEFGVGAEVDVEVERNGARPVATPWIIYIIPIVISIAAFLLLMRKFKTRRATATKGCVLNGGEMLG